MGASATSSWCTAASAAADLDLDLEEANAIARRELDVRGDELSDAALRCQAHRDRPLAGSIGLEHGGRLLRVDVLHAEQLPEALLLEGGRVLRVDAAGGRQVLR